MRRTLTLLSSMLSAKTEQIGWAKLSAAWSKQLSLPPTVTPPTIAGAVERTLPLLIDAGSVPFVCRYRADVIAPLQVTQIHQLAEWLNKHQSLEATREKLLQHDSIARDRDLLFRVETSYSKAELEDLYAPFKPPSKGSLEDRIRKEHPSLIDNVDVFFYQGKGKPESLRPKEAAVTLLANRIASHPAVMDALLDTVARYCRIKVEQAKDEKSKYGNYYELDRPLYQLRDHQVLAIRRGSDQKALKLNFPVDGDRAESTIQWALRDKSSRHAMWKDAIHDAWTRLLRKRLTTRVWRDKLAEAQERSVSVFCDNLRKALLAPPPNDHRPLLSLDPGFRAGIKCALLESDGTVHGGDAGLSTVNFIPNKENGKAQLITLLQKLKELDSSSSSSLVIVGNGHGTQEAQTLVREAAEAAGMDIEIKLVDEAGASVWSVEPSAAREFPDQPPASVAAVSIGRRYQNALAELVKIPPRSLGLGMYQHDVAEKELDVKLHLTSVDAVAEVGVDVNVGSLEIISKVPGLTPKLAERIMKERPLDSRQALLKVPGLGPKTFENCAAFLRVDRGPEPLDRTLCHPESYDLARHLLKKMKWNLEDRASLGKLPNRKERPVVWKEIAEEAAGKFDVSKERVLTVIDHLATSILNPDPRLRDDAAHSDASTLSQDAISSCETLPAELVTCDALRKACPVRDIKAVVRNVLDFGMFVDFGGDSDGLVHSSKLGTKRLNEFMVGQSVAIDILGVSSTNRVSLSLAGLDHPAESLDDMEKRAAPPKKSNPRGKRAYSTKICNDEPAKKPKRGNSNKKQEL
eukprot:scaffold766_cov179-Amphora_coffeaeformis.AAC.22